MLWGSIVKSSTIVFASLVLLAGCALPWSKPAPNDEPAARPEATSPVALVASTASLTTDESEEVPDDTNLWTQIARTMMWKVPTNTLIDQALGRAISRKTNFENSARNAEPYLWFLADSITKRKLPAELALVPLIESAYRTDVRSRSGAAGLWQFMPATGRRFGLRQSPLYDERRAVIASTNAALDYLEEMHRRFGDWLLAIAAYNCGPSKVENALKNVNGASTFWDISQLLPRETQRHIPRLLAAALIVKTPKRYGVVLQPVANEPYFTELDLNGPIDFDTLVDQANWSHAEFRRLNADYLRPYTPPEGPYHIIVPTDRAASVSEALAAIPAAERLPIKVHVVRPGDTLSRIAQQYHVPINDLRHINGIKGHLIRIGDEIEIRSGAPMTVDSRTAKRHGTQTHIVQRGDSLWTLARRYGTTEARIAKLNNRPLKATLHPGQKLFIRTDFSPGFYDVAPGDSLWIIARKFDVTVKQLVTWNQLNQRSPLQPGQMLRVTNPARAISEKI